jgi:uncharacterized protein (DUF58 family)
MSATPLEKSRPDGHELVRASLPELLALRAAGATLNLEARGIHAVGSGAYVSAFKGRGMEFDETRPYQVGDDPRAIDWRVTARTGKAFTKLYREERERPVIVGLDLTPSMHFATAGMFKSVLGTRAAALIAWSAIAAGDRLGGLVFSGGNHVELRPRLGRGAVLRFLKVVTRDDFWGNAAAASATGLSEALTRMRRVARPGSLLAVISDFRGCDEDAENTLGTMARHNEVLLIAVHDPLESELPPPGRYRITDGSTDLEFDASDRERRRSYRERFQVRQARLKHLARKFNMRLVTASTVDQPYQCLEGMLGRRR